MRPTPAQPLAFGPYRLDPQARRLTRDGTELPLGGRAFDTLLALAQAAGETLSKDTLLATVWPGLVVEENNLQVQISALRKLLGEGWIVTVPNRGYRLVPEPPGAPPHPSPPGGPPLPDRPSIAVLPFANLGGDPEQEYFADGIAEDILTELTRDRRLFVIGRASSFTFRGAVDLRDVSRTLGVRYVLDGSVRRAGPRLRITARLNDATTGATIWTDRYDRDMSNIFAVQDEIASAVNAAMPTVLADAEWARLRPKPPSDFSAWELYLQGRRLLAQATEPATEAAIASFRRASALDPHFAAAHAWNAVAISRYAAIFGLRPFDEAGTEMLALAQKAIDCDPEDAHGYLAWSLALVFLGDLAAAMAATDKALDLLPSSPEGIVQRGCILVWQGQRERGRRDLADYLRRDPRGPARFIAQSNTSWSHYQDRDYALVVDYAQAVLRDGYPQGWPYRHLAAAYGQLGLVSEARAALHHFMSHWPGAFGASVSKRPPFHSPDDHAHIIEGLRKAGWTPEAA